MSKERRKHLKPVENRPGKMYSSCKVQKNVLTAVYLLNQFYQLYQLETPTYKLAKYLVPILVVGNRATQDTFLSLKQTRINNFYIPLFESIFTSLRLKKMSLSSSINHYHINSKNNLKQTI